MHFNIQRYIKMEKKNAKTQECMEMQYGLQTGKKTRTYMGLKQQKF